MKKIYLTILMMLIIAFNLQLRAQGDYVQLNVSDNNPPDCGTVVINLYNNSYFQSTQAQ